MEETAVKRSPEDYRFDLDSLRNGWMKFYEEELSDPDLRDLYLDSVEVHIEQLLAGGGTQILGKNVRSRWSVEAIFLKWLKLYLSRGLGFDDAWFFALDAMYKTEAGREDGWIEEEEPLEWGQDYDLYQPRIEAWTERLIDFGVSKEMAAEMAEVLLWSLNEISLERTRGPIHFTVVGEEEFSEA